MAVRLSIFVLTLLVFSLCELFFTRRKDTNGVGRKVNNFSLLIIGTLASQIFLKISPIVVSSFALDKGFGLFNVLELPRYLEIFSGVVLLDLIIYFQHRFFHYSNFFWKFHRVHHIDNLLDITTALRFHPLEILFSLLIKSTAVLFLGLSIDTVLIFEVILSSMAIFNHANIQLPKRVESLLSYIFVTPNFHVIHHHPISSNHNSNYGFNLSIWDYIFKTYTQAKSEDFKTYECGLEGVKDNSLKGMLMSPFKR